MKKDLIKIWILGTDYTIFAPLMIKTIVHRAPKSLMCQWDYRGNSIELFQRQGRYVSIFNH